jgi:hypothetical protein
MPRRLPPHVQAALAKRRGTARQRKLAYDFQAPVGEIAYAAWNWTDCPAHPCRHCASARECPEWQGRLEKARDMIRERQPQFDFSTRATAKPGGK